MYARKLGLAFALMVLANCDGSGRSDTISEEAKFAQWQPIELDFIGPATSENNAANPFTDYRLTVTFRNGEKSQVVRGFFAADGKAAESSASDGAVWRVRFAAGEPGEWTYTAQLRAGPDVALSDDPETGTDVDISDANGLFEVTSASEDAAGFYSMGFLRQEGHSLRLSNGDYWLKGGANSPENMLAYDGFDGTYRRAAQNRDGEAAIDTNLHSFAPHIPDWSESDPNWKEGKAKGIIGALNYLSDQGMNAVYLLTMNVDGDGNDVWPWADPDDPTRFDVSKLAQWNIVFGHMQKRGIAIHLVTQETENELMIDGGDTSRIRRLYYRELIARFAHHPALFWNLGEENGPVHWSPTGQTDTQRKAMAEFIAANDPYQHPVLLHTHSEAADKDAILTPLLGESALSGLSFQVGDRTSVNAEVRKWQRLSSEAGRPWIIGMDEIGMWHTGARADQDDPTHDSLRRHALWGALLAGGAGVEWYFGAHQKGNDLTTEDWRSRAELWRQTKIALDFFESELPFWEMMPCEGNSYCLKKADELFAFYLSVETPMPDRSVIAAGAYVVRLFDPLTGRFDDESPVVDWPSAVDALARRQVTSRSDKVVLMTRVLAGD